MTDEEYEYLFHQGTLFSSYEYMGCIFERGYAVFRVWAPSALRVTLIGEFNDWIEEDMFRKTKDGIWQSRSIPAQKGQEYKFVIYSSSGKCYKSDPYAKQSNTRQYTNSIVSDHNFIWTDQSYLRRRARKNIFRSPMNIYEAHIGSWKKGLNYRLFADEIAPYLKEMGYTHLELMGISEYPFDDSWGYQVTGYFSPTRRYGENSDFAYLVDKLHSFDIGVIVDWVPGHFPRNSEGLFRFDGSELYEKKGIMGEHKEWGTCCFDYGKNEVKSFLISSAVMWFKVYHVDGLRVDAVASMLYLDYGRTNWQPNIYGGNENLEAVDFLRKLNEEVHKIRGVFTIAEESTAWRDVTKKEGLGFDFKWNMGWMNDTLSYLKTDPIYRRYEHNKMTFSMTYAFSENYVLPISHDEVVYGKCSLINKAVGSYEQKFGSVKAYLAFMYAHPGKKLLFMGTELGQFDEWDFRGEINWGLLQFEKHRELHEFVKTLNNIYLKYKPFYSDDSWQGFRWAVVDDRDRNIFAIERKYKEESILIIVNFSPVFYGGYHISSTRKNYKSLLGSKPTYLSGGINVDIPGYGVIILRSPKERTK